jgi:raffinose/stachyose/melibiose transport system permease protein
VTVAGDSRTALRAAPISSRRRRAGNRSGGPGEPRFLALVYLAPALVAMSMILLVPLVLTAWLSLMEWDGVGSITWVGLDNYVSLVNDPFVIPAMQNAVLLTVFYSVLPIIIGLLTAATLARVTARLRTPLRALLFLPAIIAPVVVAVGWRLIYTPSTGLLDQVLATLGIASGSNPWLGDFSLALPATGVVATWMEYGLVMVLFISGIQNIPAELYDAARVDGAGVRQEFRYVTLPGLRNELLVAVVVTVIASFRNFDLVYNLTRGGPGISTDVPVLEVYRRAFLYGQVGSGAALGLTIAFVILCLTVVIVLGSRRWIGADAA